MFATLLQRAPFQRALELVQERHFLTKRRLAGSERAPFWVNDQNSNDSPLTWETAEETQFDTAFLPLPGDLEEKLDLRSTPGAHLWYQNFAAKSSLPLPDQAVAVSEGCAGVHSADTQPRSMLVFACHHSVADGMGGGRFVNELLIAYNNLLAGRDWQDGLRRLEPARLAQRNQLGLSRWDYLKHIWKQPIALIGMSKFLFRGFHTIVAGRLETPSETSADTSLQTFGLIGRWISSDLSAQIDRFATDKSVSANSIAMAAVFYALPTWCRQQGDDPVEKWFRMVLPISIASKDDLRLPMTNRATIVQVDRCEEQMQDVDSFLHYLDREIKIIVRWQFDKLFLIIVRLMSASHWWLRRSAASPQARGTVVFTNLGQAMRSVDRHAKKFSGEVDRTPSDRPAEIIDFDFAGPTRNALPLNFTIQRYQQRYRISARFDGRCLAPSQADDFLRQVEEELQRLTGR